MPTPTRTPVHPELAAAIARTGRTNTSIGAEVGVSGTYLGHIIRGHAQPSAALRARIAEALGRPESELFANAIDRLLQQRIEQGHGATVTDPATLSRVATIIGGDR